MVAVLPQGSRPSPLVPIISDGDDVVADYATALIS